MSLLFRRSAARLLAAATGAALVVTGTVLPALADTRPSDPAEPVTVSADALPTVQVDGVVWQQLVVGDTVYVAGDFATARPAGAAPGTSTVPRTNLLAYDLRTGNLVPSFAPTTNAQVLTIAASPDGRRLYIGGDFTQVNGRSVWRIAAIDARTGALDPTFLPRPDAKVRAIVAHGDTVWFGGLFNVVGSATRARLAAVSAVDGSVRDWAPAAPGGSGVNAMVLSPDASKLVVAGSFTSLAGSNRPGYGLGAVDAVSGASLPFAANDVVRNGGTTAAFTSLSTDGDLVYGTGYTYGRNDGNLEGTFAAEWGDGTLRWLEDCHGDTYSAAPMGDVVYQASHKHYCGNMGGFPQTEPWTMYRGTAMTKIATGTATREPYGYFNFEGRPTPSLLNWYPNINQGFYTGQGQGPWNVVTTGDYVLYGGEFTAVNGTPQQGLVRFARRELAPNDRGPVLTGGKFELTAASTTSGTVRLSWLANHDQDNRELRYELIRNSNTASPVYTTVQASTFYQRPPMGFTDTGLTPGVEYRYRLRAIDPYGNIAWGDTQTVTVSGAAPQASAYRDAVLADQPASTWSLGDAAGRLTDSAGWNDLNPGAGVTRGAAGAVPGSGGAATFSGTSDGVAVTGVDAWGEHRLTVEGWFRTTTTRGGAIIAFGNLPDRDSQFIDRHVYMDNNGRLNWGSRGGTSGLVVTSPRSYNDGQWHHVAATLGASGMRLYVDGERVGSRGDVTKGRDAYGFWRIGGDNLAGWANRPTSNFFAGTIDEVSVFHRELTHAQVAAHWAAAGRTSPLPPAPADAYGRAVQELGPELYWRTDERTGTTAADASFYATPGTYRGGVTLGVPGALSGVPGTAVTFDGSTGMLASTRQVTNPRIYSVELWFTTRTTAGGTLAGLSGSATGLSVNRDRQIVMEPDGRLGFGVGNGGETVVRSTSAYNDGRWHHVVASQSPEGMRLFVDGALVGSDPRATGPSYAGYWKVGGERSWVPQPYFAGTIDEVAVYASALTPEQVAQHEQLGHGPLNTPPTAAFTETVEHLALRVDGATSADPDGSVVGWAWEFGDGGTASGATATHTYAAAGTYEVRLTVTDDRGATATTTRSVTVTAPPPAGVIATDAFGRTEAGAWGTADVGGAWALTGATNRFSVAGGAGRMTMPSGGAGASAFLPVSSAASDVRVAVQLDRLPDVGAVFASVAGRRVGADDYRSKVRIGSDGAVTLYLTRVVSGSEITLASGVVSGLTYAVGDRLNVRMEVTGSSPTTLKAVVWKAGQPEPSSWRLTTTNTAASLQAPGGVGLVTYLGTTTTNVPLTVSFDDLSAVAPGATPPPVNTPPVAAFTEQVADLAVQLDGSASSDAEGAVASWAWSLGDGATATGPTANHTYAAAGTYPVTLTVTDAGGLTSSVTRQVTVSAPAPGGPLAQDAFARTVTAGWGTADVGGPWTHVGAAQRFSVEDGTGRVTIPTAGGGGSAHLAGVVSDRTDVSTVFGFPALPDAGAVVVSLTGRRVGADEYRTKLRVGADGAVTLYLTRVAGSQELTLVTTNVAGLNVASGERLRVRMGVEGTGTTTLRARVWKDGEPEPGAWQRSTTNTHAGLQAAGSVGVVTYLSATTTNLPYVVTVDDLLATTPV